MASTVVPAIRRRWPNAHVGWAAGRSIAPLVRLMSGIDEVIEIDDASLLGGHHLPAAQAMFRAWWDIGRHWDHAIVAHTDRRYAWLTQCSGARAVVRFSDALARQPGSWYGQQYQRLVEGDDSPEPRAVLAAIDLTRLPVPPVIAGAGPLVVVAPGGARNLLRDDHLRRWPITNWVETVRELAALGARVVAVGGRGDVAECQRCADAGATNFAQRTTLPELMALLNAADLVITHDSGPLHLALALGRPVVALFGPTSPREFVPSNANVTVLTRAEEMPCAPCYDGRNFAACSLNECLTRLLHHEVVHTAAVLLFGTRAPLREQRVSLHRAAP